MSRKRSIIGAFVTHSLDMRRSLAWRFLPDTARRVLDQLEVEHMEQGATENGRLIVTYDQLELAGIRRKSIALAIRQLEELGFVQVLVHGGLSVSRAKFPSRYRLTHIFSRSTGGPKGSVGPTEEWRKITTADEARDALARAARRSPKRNPQGFAATNPLH